ncbi:aminoglycoside phosphotransferase family protein [Kitasatospora sp. NPDC002227]|uniref:aminoglycoside phosphotransferase family protein n=1 Tax=Kitasatospora sp. NPDC002227 TaxID=3154773 RepID=UPI00332597BD
MLDEWLDRWELTLERVCVASGPTALVRQADGEPAVLRLRSSAGREAAALRQWDGHGAVRLLRAEGDALLLERLHADIPLRSLAEPKAMLEAASLLRQLWVTPGAEGGIPRLSEELTARLAELRANPARAEAEALFEEAAAAAERLLADQPEELLLHGDLHHGHVLAADRSPWLAVSPRPVLGERAYDLALLAQDRLDTLAGQPGPRAAARRRLQKLAESVEVDPERLRGWALFRAVETGLRHLAADERRAGELYLEFAAWL